MLTKASLAILLFYFKVTTAKFDIEAECTVDGEELKWIKNFHDTSGKLSTISFVSLFKQSVNALGEGNYGIVRLVSIQHLFDTVGNPIDYEIAVKEIKIANVKSEELDVHKEINSHVYAPSLYLCQFNKEKTHLYIVQEVLRKKLTDITTVVAISKKTVKQAIKFWKTGSDALLHMHSKKLVHQDIKPDNVMTDESVNRIFLLDFGLAQRTTDSIKPLAGTPLFMSFGRNENTILDIRNDFYAYVLTIATVYSDYDNIFMKVDKQFINDDFDGDPRICFEIPRSLRHHPVFKNHEMLEEFCLKYLTINLIRVLEPIFGEVKIDALNNDPSMGFTTLMVKILNYRINQITVEEIKEAFEFMVSDKTSSNTAGVPPEITGDYLTKSQQLLGEHDEFQKECEKFINQQNLDAIPEEEKEKKRLELLNKRKQIEAKETEHLNQNHVVVNHGDLLKTQRRIDRPEEFNEELAQKHKVRRFNTKGIKLQRGPYQVRQISDPQRMTNLSKLLKEISKRRRGALNFVSKNQDGQKDGPKEGVEIGSDPINDYGLQARPQNISGDNLLKGGRKIRKGIFDQEKDLNSIHLPKQEKPSVSKEYKQESRPKLNFNKDDNKPISYESDQQIKEVPKASSIKSPLKIGNIKKALSKESTDESSAQNKPDSVKPNHHIPPKIFVNDKEVTQVMQERDEDNLQNMVVVERRKRIFSEEKNQPAYVRPSRLDVDNYKPIQPSYVPRPSSLERNPLPLRKNNLVEKGQVRPSSIYQAPKYQNLPKQDPISKPESRDYYRGRDIDYKGDLYRNYPNIFRNDIGSRGQERSNSLEERIKYPYTANDGFYRKTPRFDYYKEHSIPSVYSNPLNVYSGGDYGQPPVYPRPGLQYYYGQRNYPPIYRII